MAPPCVQPYAERNFTSLGDISQCEPYAASLVCSNADTGEVYKTISLTYNSLSVLGENQLSVVVAGGQTKSVDFQKHNSTSPYIRDQNLVIIHNDGSSIGSRMTCTVSAHVCHVLRWPDV